MADKNYCTTEEACNILGVTSIDFHHNVRRHGQNYAQRVTVSDAEESVNVTRDNRKKRIPL